MREIPIFIASSVREFERERKELFSLLDALNTTFGKRGAKLVWNPPETNSRTLTFGGKQLDFDAFIPISEFFILIIGERVGQYTRHEYGLALERFKRTRKPKILPCFLESVSKEARDFRDSIRRAEIGAQYVDFYKDFGDIKNQILFELTNYAVNIVETDDDETEADNRLNRIKRKIHTLRGEIEHLETLTVTQETVAEIAYQYAEMARLVRKYKVEPDALLDYMNFLRQQHMYGEAMEAGHWLEGFYQMERPGDFEWSLLKDGLGMCYEAANQYERAERYYREELEILWRLPRDDSDYERGIAGAYFNLAILLRKSNKTEEAEIYFREALELYKNLAFENSFYEPHVANAYNSLGELLRLTNRPDKAEPCYREALEIQERLAEDNPDNPDFEESVAVTCNNLGELLRTSCRMEEADVYHTRALEIRRRLVKRNPNAIEMNLATTCNNCGVLCAETGRAEEAEAYYREALEIYRRLGKSNPGAVAPYEVMTCNNLACLLSETDRIEEAKKYYREALEIPQRLADVNPNAYLPYVAGACKNLAILLSETSQIEEAEAYYREALESYIRLAEANPDAYLPDVAMTCYNLGMLELERDDRDAAKEYLEEALSLYEEYPRFEEEAQACFEALDALHALDMLAELHSKLPRDWLDEPQDD